jgi:hypothetical protein
MAKRKRLRPSRDVKPLKDLTSPEYEPATTYAVPKGGRKGKPGLWGSAAMDTAAPGGRPWQGGRVSPR